MRQYGVRNPTRGHKTHGYPCGVCCPPTDTKVGRAKARCQAKKESLAGLEDSDVVLDDGSHLLACGAREELPDGIVR